ncbi:ATP-binding cassette domain-containing protein [Fusibacter sp. JL298sf-3]
MKNYSIIFMNLKYILHHLMKASRKIVFFELLSMVITVTEFFLVNVLILKYIIDSLTTNSSIRSIIAVILIGMILKSAKIVVCNYYKHYVLENEKLKLEKYFNSIINKQAATVDLGCYDNVEYFDSYVITSKRINENSLILLQDISILVSTILTIILTTSYALIVDFKLILLIIIPILLDSRLRIIIGKLEAKKDIELERKRRFQDYVVKICKDVKFAKEMRLTKMSEFYMNKFNENNSDILYIHNSYFGKLMRMYLFSDFLYEPKNIIVTLYLAYNVIETKSISPGEFLAVQASLLALSSNLGKINKRLVVFDKHSRYIDKFKEFIEYKTNLVDGDVTLDKVESIEFKNVAFSYSEDSVLKNISFKVNRGESLALVGENGEGKTTILKLLMRFYDVDSGAILINGSNIKDYNLKSLRRSFQPVLQSFNIYKTNIVGNIAFKGADLTEESDVTNAIKKVGLSEKFVDLCCCNNMYIGKDLHDNAIELSGGEKQLLAIARSIHFEGKIVLMDEPSSALDAHAESRLVDLLDAIKLDKISIIVSHRLTLAHKVDKIAVIKSGEVVEHGKLIELLNKKGVYYDMENAQRETRII